MKKLILALATASGLALSAPVLADHHGGSGHEAGQCDCLQRLVRYAITHPSTRTQVLDGFDYAALR